MSEAVAAAVPWLGYLAGGLTVVSLVPQVARVWRTRRTRDLSRWMFVLLTGAGVLWLIYGVLRADWPLVATNAGLVVLNGIILVAKIRHG